MHWKHMMIPPPLALRLTLCEKAIIEDGTKDITLVSTFRTIIVEKFPSPPQRFTAFAVPTDGLGDGTIDFVITNVETDEEVYARQITVRFPDRLAEIRLLLRITRCSFPAPGTYEVVLSVDGDWIAQRRVKVSAKEV
jgi:hypothetical protein